MSGSPAMGRRRASAAPSAPLHVVGHQRHEQRPHTEDVGIQQRYPRNVADAIEQEQYRIIDENAAGKKHCHEPGAAGAVHALPFRVDTLRIIAPPPATPLAGGEDQAACTACEPPAPSSLAKPRRSSSATTRSVASMAGSWPRLASEMKERGSVVRAPRQITSLPSAAAWRARSSRTTLRPMPSRTALTRISSSSANTMRRGSTHFCWRKSALAAMEYEVEAAPHTQGRPTTSCQRAPAIFSRHWGGAAMQ